MMSDGHTLPLFQEDSPASRSVKPGSEQAQAMTATSGRRCSELYKSYPHHTSWAKTFLDCFLSTGVWYSRLCALTWNVQDTTYSRCIIRLRASVPRTGETEYSLWPTVRASDGERGGRGDLIQAVRGNENKHFKMFPTPDANCWKGGNRKAQLTDPKYGVTPNGGQLNPAWVEILQGFPPGWTEIGSEESLESQPESRTESTDCEHSETP